MVQGAIQQRKPCRDMGNAGSARIADTLDTMGCDNNHVKLLTIKKKLIKKKKTRKTLILLSRERNRSQRLNASNERK